MDLTDYRIVAIVLGLRGRGPPRPGHGVVKVITRDRRASAVCAIVIPRSSRYGGLNSVYVLLIVSWHKNSPLLEGEMVIRWYKSAHRRTTLPSGQSQVSESQSRTNGE